MTGRRQAPAMSSALQIQRAAPAPCSLQQLSSQLPRGQAAVLWLEAERGLWGPQSLTERHREQISVEATESRVGVERM